MNLKHVPPSAPTPMLDRQEGREVKGRKKDNRIMKKMTISNNNNSTGKKSKEDA